ncbi:hypothetical protein Misp01_31920 [Microtetraspora sp. NBRC 13810]|nr:hypothetical protein Misp01_31920 [Microtetraspora sp. NBRC 13810]
MAARPRHARHRNRAGYVAPEAGAAVSPSNRPPDPMIPAWLRGLLRVGAGERGYTRTPLPTDPLGD